MEKHPSGFEIIWCFFVGTLLIGINHIMQLVQTIMPNRESQQIENTDLFFVMWHSSFILAGVIMLLIGIYKVWVRIFLDVSVYNYKSYTIENEANKEAKPVECINKTLKILKISY